MTEFDLIRDLLAKVNPPGTGDDTGVWLGAGDDAAVLDAGRVVMSTDLTVEDVHFRRSWVTFLPGPAGEWRAFPPVRCSHLRRE